MRKFGVIGILSVTFGVLSIFLPGLSGITVAFLAVVLGFLGNRRREKLSMAGMIIAGIVIIYLNFQNMGILPSTAYLPPAAKHYAKAIQASQKVFEGIKQESSAVNQKKKKDAEEKILKVVESGLREAEKVDVMVFEPYLPGFSRHFRNEFIEGLKSLKNGYEKSLKKEKLKGAILLDKWGSWSRQNRESFIELWRKWRSHPSLFRAIIKK